jgi:glycolate oxidase FAD binding subunit
MTRLHVGGLGTLGVIAEVSLKLTPLPAGQATVVAEYANIRQSLAAGLDIFYGDAVPLAVVALDAEAGRRMDAPGLGGGSFLSVRLGGRPLTLERQIKECRSACQAHGPSRLEVLGESDAAGVWRRLADYGWDERTAPVAGSRAQLPPAAVPELAEALEALDRVEDLRPAIVAHPAHGTVLINWYRANGAVADGAVETVLRSARQAVHRLGGNLTIERCPVGVKSGLDVWDDVGEPIAIMRRLKERYDPDRVLNPGRFVGGI